MSVASCAGGSKASPTVARACDSTVHRQRARVGFPQQVWRRGEPPCLRPEPSHARNEGLPDGQCIAA
uniref:Uncharacterized protein n=1 Tax=Triticum urartu TaxID=4572 RepID=A0A8R7QZ53_TRIUA